MNKSSLFLLSFLLGASFAGRAVAMNQGASQPPPADMPAASRPRSELTDPQAQFLYAFEQYKAGDYAAAAEWSRKAADQGHAEAQFLLGSLYYAGRGVRQDYGESAQWLNKAAGQRIAEARAALVKLNDVQALYSRAMDHFCENDYAQAAKLFRNAADLGHAEARFYLGFCYEFGDGVRQDMKQAVAWYRKAAEQGDARAQCNLGFFYEHGNGVEQDMRQAVEWYRKAADQGNARAQYNLGYCHEFGDGVARNRKLAREWYSKAADQGDKDAIERLRHMKE